MDHHVTLDYLQPILTYFHASLETLILQINTVQSVQMLSQFKMTKINKLLFQDNTNNELAET